MPVLNTTPTIKIAQSIAAPYQRAVLTFKRGNNKIIKADPRNVDGIFYVDFSQEDLAYLGMGTASFEIQYFYDSDTKTNIETGGQMPIYDAFSDGEATGTGGIDDEKIYTAVVLQETVEVGGGSGGTSDHRLLSNRSADDQHPISAITGLQDAVTKANASIAETTADERYEPKIVEKGDAFNLSFGETPDSVVQGSRVLKAVPVDAEFTDTIYDDTAIKASVASLETDKADKTAIPTKLPNPNALTFTGASVGSYDGSEPLNINIPSSGGGGGGEDGATFTPSGTVEGSTVTFSWTNDKGRPNPEPVAVTAPQGTKGDKGDPGENGQQGLKGDKGDQGLPGDKGADGAKGDKGDPGENGTNGANGENGADAVINGVNTLTIEQGANIQLSQTGSVLTISATGGGGGGTVLPNSTTEWTVKTGRTHPVWGYEYEYFLKVDNPAWPSEADFIVFPSIGNVEMVINMMGGIRRTTGHYNTQLNVTATTDPLKNNGVNCILSPTTQPIISVAGDFRQSSGAFVWARIVFFDTADRDLSQSAQMAMLQNEINDGTQALNILGVTT